ncbi:unnamed protein product [Linum tenue]|uniref:Heme O synthase n=3 Tax=Linum tenue TaxID=586396 RepID=A0AAV0H0V9_9ROSI|nr:unnamed protein product [Linum tenue]
MWRNSASRSSKLIWNGYALSPSSLSTLRSSRSVPNSVFPLSSVPAVASPSHSPSDPSKLGFLPGRSDGIRALSSVPSPAAVDIPSLTYGVQLARHYGQCFWELSKARLSMLVVATSGTGYVLGSGSAVDFAGLCWTCAGTMMVAASANSLNQVFEIKNDALMKRTRNRPLPSGRMSVPQAVAFASSVGLAGTAMLACKTNMMAAGLAASNLVLYAFVYTPLKQIHPVNTWVGAVVGAIPPLLGWAAASGGQISLNSMILPAALYFWQIPHFMALAYMCRHDYAAGGYKMLSLADTSGRRTAMVALRNCIYMVPLGFMAYELGMASGWFCLESSVLTLAIAASAFSFYREPTTEKARKMFHASLLYLPIFMAGILLHRQTEMSTDELSSSMSAEVEDREDERSRSHAKKKELLDGSNFGTRVRAPVAYASVAPFPFLPAPSYVSS